MKKLILFTFIFGLFFNLTSCDKVDNPIKPAITIDTTLFPGNWSDYVYPTFTQNPNSIRNVLIEDYTGHRCPACPAGALVAKNVEAGNPANIFVVSIHASPLGLTNFQETLASCGDPIANPENEFCEILYCDEGIEIGTTLGNANVGFSFNPSGTINRKSFGSSDIFSFYTDWQNNTNVILGENELKVNIQASTNYYPETNGIYLHTEIEFLEDW